MKNYICSSLLLLFPISLFAQVLCVNCYDQNSTIAPNAGNSILNGSFENTTCLPYPGAFDTFCPSAFGYNYDISNWTCTGGGTNTYTHIFDTTSFVFIQDGIKAAYFGNAFAEACSITPGDLQCLSQTGCIVSTPPVGYPLSEINCGGVTGVSLQQTVSGLIPGTIYVLEFHTGGEGLNLSDGLFAVDVGFGNIFLRNPTTALNGLGRIFLVHFVATSSSHNIKFTNWGHVCQLCTELVLDNVRLFLQSQLPTSYPHCVVGVDDISDVDQGIVYPNPFSTTLNIKQTNSGIINFELFDISSRIIILTNSDHSFEINTDHVAAGIYNYRITDHNQHVSFGKLIKY